MKPKELRGAHRVAAVAHSAALACRSQTPEALRLQLPRADLADHVGTSLETVCRTLAEFKAKKLIDLPNRKTIRFINLEGLARISNGPAFD